MARSVLTLSLPTQVNLEDTVCGDGSFCMSFDLPGVCGDDILVLPNENEVKFYGENKEVYEHDESCRIFMGAVNGAFFCAPGVPLSSHHIAWDAEFGVLKVRISPPGRARSS
ncbi:hypothetical protein HID58_054969 [Brassica napus]|uniref:SHSP domain-containing protein n=1 Tax=Brassica napus TaxID=3708 RepID=A0ABQ8AKK0_BRANA|nr:uncharacterized protein BNAC03G50330D [Brassica napus]KAH0892540.1 hypothetical protein HID58_054969 [Brassica napus]